MDTEQSLKKLIKEDTPEENKPRMEDAENNVYCFETDHVALKANPDYQELIKTVALLEAQRSQAIQDLDKLIQAKEDALADPIAFVEKLQTKVDLRLPIPQTLAQIPHIQWEKYTSNIESYTWSHKHRTRYKRQREATTTTKNSSRCSPPSQPVSEVSTADSTARSQSPDNFVRGKVKNESKPASFNRLWTEEEQRRLEELLLKYPTEEVEARRWEKIAKELGNRSKFQVQSRMQKYLIRLASEGLPVPGRRPNSGAMQKRRVHHHHRYHRLLFPHSTLSSTYRPPVYMSDDEGDGHYSQYHVKSEPVQVSDEEDVPVELRDTPEYAEIMRLKQEKAQQLGYRLQPSGHVGFSCDKCGCEPIPDTRWHCTDCPPELSVDFCDNCSDFVFENAHHRQSHHLEAVAAPEREGQEHVDRDYQPSQFRPGDYNYLDPNYMPAA